MYTLQLRTLLATSALCIAAVGACGGWCNAAPQQAKTQQSRVKPTHEEVRLRHIKQAQEKLARCKEFLDAMQAEVEVYGFGQGSPCYAVKEEDMPRLRYIVSQLQANPEYRLSRVRMSHSRRLYCLNLDFGNGVYLSLRAECITSPDRTGISHTGNLYALPDASLRRELIGIIERALPPKKQASVPN